MPSSRVAMYSPQHQRQRRDEQDGVAPAPGACGSPSPGSRAAAGRGPSRTAAATSRPARPASSAKPHAIAVATAVQRGQPAPAGHRGGVVEGGAVRVALGRSAPAGSGTSSAATQVCTMNSTPASSSAPTIARPICARPPLGSPRPASRCRRSRGSDSTAMRHRAEDQRPGEGVRVEQRLELKPLPLPVGQRPRRRCRGRSPARPARRPA